VSRWIVRAAQRRDEDREFDDCCRRLEAAFKKIVSKRSAR